MTVRATAIASLLLLVDFYQLFAAFIDDTIKGCVNGFCGMMGDDFFVIRKVHLNIDAKTMFRFFLCGQVYILQTGMESVKMG
jgi:hypothetical protein